MKLKNLIIFDYSGTISLKSVLFSSNESILQALHKSGLDKFGVCSPKVFWNRIVNPTWKKGSLTPIGYTSVIQSAVKEWMLKDSIFYSEEGLQKSAESFVHEYLENSQPDSRWGGILEALMQREDCFILIATDHYAEATQYFQDHFARIGIKMEVVQPSSCYKPSKAALFLANSADLGYHKNDPEYWYIIKQFLSPHKVGKVILVDDFGYNEHVDDAYAELQKVEKRQKQTADILSNTFDCEIVVLPFLLPRMKDSSIGKFEHFQVLIQKTGEEIFKIINESTPKR